jgi:hypothetical protein
VRGGLDANSSEEDQRIALVNTLINRKKWGFLDQLSDHLLLKDSAPWNYTADID